MKWGHTHSAHRVRLHGRVSTQVRQEGCPGQTHPKRRPLLLGAAPDQEAPKQSGLQGCLLPHAGPSSALRAPTGISGFREKSSRHNGKGGLGVGLNCTAEPEVHLGNRKQWPAGALGGQ